MDCKLRKTREGKLNRLSSLELQRETIHRAGEKMDSTFLIYLSVRVAGPLLGPKVSASLNPGGR